MLSTTNSVIFKLLLAAACFLLEAGCASVERPYSYVWGINGSASQREGYNIKTDYDSEGVRLPNAKSVLRPLGSLRELNGAVCFLPAKANDPLKDEGIRGLKAWLGNLRDWSKEHCQ